MKKKLLKPALLIGAAIVLLGASVANSTYAMLTVISDDYYSEIEMKSIGVTLQENGEKISWRDYNGSDDSWNETTGVLLQKMIPEGEKLQLGKKYKEELTVFNSGKIDTYVRVVITKKWFDANGEEDYTLNPDLIRLTIKEGNGWRLSTEESSSDKIVMYYDKILKVGETTPAFTTDVSIDPVLKTANTAIEKDRTDLGAGYKEVTLSYDYDGYSFRLAAESNAVQTHNEADAKTSAWGVGNDDDTVMGEGEPGEIAEPEPTEPTEPDEPTEPEPDEPTEPDEPDEPEPEPIRYCEQCDGEMTRAGEDQWVCMNPECDVDKNLEDWWKCTRDHYGIAGKFYWNSITETQCGVVSCDAKRP